MGRNVFKRKVCLIFSLFSRLFALAGDAVIEYGANGRGAMLAEERGLGRRGFARKGRNCKALTVLKWGIWRKNYGVGRLEETGKGLLRFFFLERGDG